MQSVSLSVNPCISLAMFKSSQVLSEVLSRDAAVRFLLSEELI